MHSFELKFRPVVTRACLGVVIGGRRDSLAIRSRRVEAPTKSKMTNSNKKRGRGARG